MQNNLYQERTPILEKINRYQPLTSEETAMKQQLITFIQNNPDCFKRTLEIGHVTGSAWIINQEYTHGLLTHHGKLNKWFQLGGHSDGDPDTYAVALREAQEESGLSSLKAISQDIFDIDIHPIPQKGNEPDHLHYDIRFLFTADIKEPFQVSSESHDLQWVKLEGIAQLNPSESITRMVTKTEQLQKKREN
jgi:8-oxo-dGTP pyrophosphatase MutT (NUDIX family)